LTTLDRRVLVAGLLAAGVTAAKAQVAGPTIRDIAPKGRLRAAINSGNIVLARRDPDGELRGVSVDLARELARRLNLPLELVPFDTAGKVTASAGSDVWDIAFLAIDPLRAAEITFTPPYVLIEGTYLVPDASPLRSVADFDRRGLRIAVGRGSAYDLFLTRTLKQSSLVRAETSEDAIRTFVDDKLDAAAGVKQLLVISARDRPGFRVIPGRFMAIEQAMGVPRGREAAAVYLRDFIEEMKASGFVAAALARHQQPDAAVAPPSNKL
jgi:polar amino acid transport system substrate-binding protein